MNHHRHTDLFRWSGTRAPERQNSIIDKNFQVCFVNKMRTKILSKVQETGVCYSKELCTFIFSCEDLNKKKPSTQELEICFSKKLHIFVSKLYLSRSGKK